MFILLSLLKIGRFWDLREMPVPDPVFGGPGKWSLFVTFEDPKISFISFYKVLYLFYYHCCLFY